MAVRLKNNLKESLTMLRCVYGAISLLLVCWVFAATSAGAASEVVIKRFKSGAGPDAVGMVDASADTELASPQALYAGDKGELLLLDQINGRILRFDPKRPEGSTRSLVLPPDLRPSDLIVHDGDIVVWDGAAHSLQPIGQDDTPERGLEELSTRAAEDETVRSTFAQMGSQAPDGDTDLLDGNGRGVSVAADAPARQIVASRGRGAIVATVVRNKSDNDVTIGVRSRDHADAIAVLHLQVRERLGAVEFLDIDNRGRMFVLVEDIPQSSRHGASAFVVRFAPTGMMEGVYELPLAESIAMSRRFVTVSEDGDVYFLRTRRSEVDVLGVGFRPLRDDTVVDTRARTETHAITVPRHHGAMASVRPLTRERIIETAFAFEGARWRLTSSVYGRDPDTVCAADTHRMRRPAYLDGHLGQEIRGIPYCWGCHGSLAEIQAEIDRGELAGNVCTHNAPRGDVVGVDCSAFVSAAWGLETHFNTTAIQTISTPLANAWDLQPGDALNKPGSHVMLFLRFTPDRKAEVMEAAPAACNGRVCRNIYPLASLLARGFEPVRYRAVAGDETASASETVKQEADDVPRRRHRRHGGIHGKKSVRAGR
jgi:hypothetical protein